MNRRELLRLIASGPAALFFERLARAQAAITLQPLTDRITVLTGAGGNITILKADDGLLMVDAGLPDTAAAVTAKAREVAPVAVRYLINTHWHYDHVGANETLGKSGTTILAHVNTAKRLSTTQRLAAFNREFPALPEAGRPKQTFQDKGKLTFAGESVNYQALPPAHTDGDTVILFEHANVYAAGDLFFNGMFPFIDYSSGGSLAGMVRDSEQMLKAVDDKTKIVPGHGPVADKAKLQIYHDVLADAYEQLSKLIKQGKTADEIVAAEPLKKYDQTWGQGFMKTPDWLKLNYQGMVGTK